MSQQKPTTKDKLAEIRARLAKATPGPWTNDYKPDGCTIDKGGFEIAVTNEAEYFSGDFSTEMCKANADLIANAPADLSALLEIVEIQGKALEDLIPKKYSPNCACHTTAEYAIGAAEEVWGKS